MIADAADAATFLRKRLLSDDATRRAYRDGDHWQSSAGWSGPRPQAGEAGEQTILQEIQAAFTVRDALNETLNRHTAGVIGRAPSWRMLAPSTTPDGQPTPLPELDAILTVWWNAADAEMALQTFVQTLRSRGRAVLRLYVPAPLRDQPIPSGADPVSAYLARVRIDTPDPTIAGVLRNTTTWQDEGVLITQATTGDVYASIDGVVVSQASGTDVLERVRLDDQGLTVIEQVGGQTDASDPLDLGGRLTMREWTLKPLWTPAMLTMQRLLNLAMTMLGRNVIQGGFLERIITNAQLPGRFERDATTGKDRFIPDALQVGAGTTNFFAGLELKDPMTGEVKGYANPGVYWRDPASPETFTATRDAAYSAMLEEAQQVHALLSGETGVSSESRRQALADYEASLNLTAPIVRSAVAWLLETAYAWALAFARQAPPLATADVSVQLSLGPLTQADAELATGLHDAGLWSRQRAMAHTHVEDTDAEAATIAAEAPVNTPPAGSGAESINPQGGTPNASA